MGRAARLVPALAATLLVAAPAALALAATTTSAPTTSVAVTTTTTPAGQHCGAVLGPGARWIATGPTCEVEIARGSSVAITLSSAHRWGPLATASARLSVATRSHPATGGLTGSIRARAIGVGVVTDIESAVCPPGLACPLYAMLWSLRVKVVAPSALPVTLTRADSGRVVTVARGRRVEVSLAGPSGYTWTTPVADDSSVLERLSGSPGQATFRAVGAGSTRVSAVDNPNCYPACLPPSLLFQVTVVVR